MTGYQTAEQTAAPHQYPAGIPATLAASCDRLRPGAGSWPWVAVVGMYAIPVAWNLVAIQPAATLAVVVCVVGVVIARVRYRREVR